MSGALQDSGAEQVWVWRNYVRDKVLGRGGSGTAVLLTRTTDEHHVVQKEVGVDGLSDKQKEECENEVIVLRMLCHPNILTCLDSYPGESRAGVPTLNIVTEYCAGGTLEARIKRARASHQRLPEAQVASWLVQLADALAHMHAKHVLHRDVKTSNIFLTAGEAPLVKLGDLGIARILKQTDAFAETCIGTPYYLSPEMVQGTPYGPQSDVWSLGVVLYELLTLRRPFTGDNITTLAWRICQEEPEPLGGEVGGAYSEALCTLVGTMLRKDPAHRVDLPSFLESAFVLERLPPLLELDHGALRLIAEHAAALRTPVLSRAPSPPRRAETSPALAVAMGSHGHLVAAAAAASWEGGGAEAVGSAPPPQDKSLNLPATSPRHGCGDGGGGGPRLLRKKSSSFVQRLIRAGSHGAELAHLLTGAKHAGSGSGKGSPSSGRGWGGTGYSEGSGAWVSGDLPVSPFSPPSGTHTRFGGSRQQSPRGAGSSASQPMSPAHSPRAGAASDLQVLSCGRSASCSGAARPTAKVAAGADLGDLAPGPSAELGALAPPPCAPSTAAVGACTSWDDIASPSGADVAADLVSIDIKSGAADDAADQTMQAQHCRFLERALAQARSPPSPADARRHSLGEDLLSPHVRVESASGVGVTGRAHARAALDWLGRVLSGCVLELEAPTLMPNGRETVAVIRARPQASPEAAHHPGGRGGAGRGGGDGVTLSSAAHGEEEAPLPVANTGWHASAVAGQCGACSAGAPPQVTEGAPAPAAAAGHAAPSQEAAGQRQHKRQPGLNKGDVALHESTLSSLHSVHQGAAAADEDDAGHPLSVELGTKLQWDGTTVTRIVLSASAEANSALVRDESRFLVAAEGGGDASEDAGETTAGPMSVGDNPPGLLEAWARGSAAAGQRAPDKNAVFAWMQSLAGLDAAATPRAQPRAHAAAVTLAAGSGGGAGGAEGGRRGAQPGDGGLCAHGSEGWPDGSAASQGLLPSVRRPLAFPPPVLSVRIVSARRLNNIYLLPRTLCPYVTLRVGKVKHRTPVLQEVGSRASKAWLPPRSAPDDAFRFDLAPGSLATAELQVAIKDRNNFGRNEWLATTSIRIVTIPPSTGAMGTFLPVTAQLPARRFRGSGAVDTAYGTELTLELKLDDMEGWWDMEEAGMDVYGGAGAEASFPHVRLGGAVGADEASDGEADATPGMQRGPRRVSPRLIAAARALFRPTARRESKMTLIGRDDQRSSSMPATPGSGPASPPPAAAGRPPLRSGARAHVAHAGRPDSWGPGWADAASHRHPAQGASVAVQARTRASTGTLPGGYAHAAGSASLPQCGGESAVSAMSPAVGQRAGSAGAAVRPTPSGTLVALTRGATVAGATAPPPLTNGAAVGEVGTPACELLASPAPAASLALSGQGGGGGGVHWS